MKEDKSKINFKEKVKYGNKFQKNSLKREIGKDEYYIYLKHGNKTILIIDLTDLYKFVGYLNKKFGTNLILYDKSKISEVSKKWVEKRYFLNQNIRKLPI